jgi:hypothetical protein
MPKPAAKPASRAAVKPASRPTAAVSRLKISALKADRRNANKGTDRGRKALDHSLRDLGAGRSILIDRAGRIIAGNKTVEAAKKGGALDQDILVVKTDGRQIVAVQRTDLDLEKDSKAKALAVADNRVSELDLAWDVDALAQLAREANISAFFTEKELRKLGVGLEADALEKGIQPEMTSGYAVMIEDLSEAKQVELLARLTKEGFSCRALTF